ncbi:MAG: Acg family FMN-binding oxidoreductase [Candidatus Kapaibacterium sp.]
MESMLHYASLAANGHNTQPWRVKVKSPTEAILFLDKSRLLPAVDPDNREAIISLGAFAENFAIGAKNEGYDAEFDIIANSPHDGDFAQIKLNPANAGNFELRKIETRRTVRSNFGSREISDADFKYITGGDSEHFDFVGADSQSGKFIAVAAVEATRVQTWRDDAQRELSQWIRWSKAIANDRRDGITPEMLDITGIARLIVGWLYKPKNVMTDSFRKRSVDIAAKSVKNHGGWIMVTSPDNSMKDWFNTGRRTQRMLLNIRERDIAIHPMNQMIEEKDIATEVQKKLAGSGHIQLMLRAGYMDKYPDPVAPRRRVRDFAERA